jgi:hypothetical protein
MEISNSILSNFLLKLNDDLCNQKLDEEKISKLKLMLLLIFNNNFDNNLNVNEEIIETLFIGWYIKDFLPNIRL